MPYGYGEPEAFVDVLLWVVQVAVGLVALFDGMVELTYPRRTARERFRYRTGRSVPAGPTHRERVVGALTAVAALALVLPGLLDRVVLLTPLAAALIGVKFIVVRWQAAARLGSQEHFEAQIRAALESGMAGVVRLPEGRTPVGSVLLTVLVVAACAVIVWGRLGPYPL